uniref:CD109 antigen n=1 Tax=Timema shepardi TaxID=629360 RepID=A0A7R9ATG1_TIMSH|nr:unnamed protein product [Timema shepardi]
MTIFVQTDKPVYMQGQTVRFRAIPISTELRAFDNAVDVYMRDPFNRIMRRWLSRQSNFGSVSLSYQLSDQPVFGEWVIQVIAQGQVEETRFLVEEYYQTRFEVNVTMPAFFFNTDQYIHGKIMANYTSGAPVHGNLTLRATIRPLIAQSSYRGVGDRRIVEKYFNFFNGVYEFRYPIAELEQFVPSLEGMEVKVTATVGDRFLDEIVEGYSMARIFNSSIKVAFLGGSPQVFKPSMPFYVYLAMSYHDGSPLSRERLRLGAMEVRSEIVTRSGGRRNLDTRGLPMSTQRDGVWEMKVDLRSQLGYDENARSKDLLNDIQSMKISASFLDARGERVGADLLLLSHFSPMNHHIKVSTSTRDAKFTVFINNRKARTGEKVEVAIYGEPGAYVGLAGLDRAFYTMQAQSQLSYMGLIVFSDVPVTRRPELCNITSGLGECLNGRCYRIEKKCDGQFDCEDGTDESGCMPTNFTILNVFRQFRFNRIQRLYENVWLWKDINIGPHGRYIFEVPVPERPTHWMVSAISMSPSKGFGMLQKAIEYVGVLPFFMNVEMPTVSRQGEQIGIRCTVFNYMTSDIEAIVVLAGSRDYKFVHVEMNGIVRSYNPRTSFGEHQFFIFIKAQDAATVHVPIVPTKLGDIFVTVQASTLIGKDIITRKLHVEADGLPQYRHQSVLLDLSNRAYVFQYMHVNITETPIIPYDEDRYYIYGSNKATVSIVGDVVGPIFPTMPVNATSLLSLPMDCAEQTMFSFATNLYTVLYMRLVNQRNSSQEKQAFYYMNIGYQRSLSYFNPDGSFSLFRSDWNQSASSVWLTSFCVQTLQQASFYEWENFIYIDPDVRVVTVEGLESSISRLKRIQTPPDVSPSSPHTPSAPLIPQSSEKVAAYLTERTRSAATRANNENTLVPLLDSNLVTVIANAVKWLLRHQTPDGSFYEVTWLPDRKMNDSLLWSNDYIRFRNISLTAHVLITLASVRDLTGGLGSQVALAEAKAVRWLERNIKLLSERGEPFEVAIVAYALLQAKAATAETAFGILARHARSEGGLTYWGKEAVPAPPYKMENQKPFMLPRLPYKYDSSNIEATAYALLTYVARQEVLTDPIVKWLNAQRLTDGGWASTQDTAMAMQALIQYTQRARIRDVSSLSVTVEATALAGKTKTLYVNDKNRALLQTLEIPEAWGTVKVQAKGAGYAILQMTVQYNVDIVKFQTQPPIRSFDLRTRADFHGRNQSHITYISCQRWTNVEESVRSGMAVLDVTIPTGYIIQQQDLDAYTLSRRVHNLRRARFQGRKVLFYFDYLDITETCINFTIERWFPVANMSRYLPIRVYDYYAPERFNETIHDSIQTYLLNICEVCGSSQCPYCPIYNLAITIPVPITILTVSAVILLLRHWRSTYL